MAAVGAGDQHRPVRDPTGQVAEHIQAQLIGPVQVLENDQHRPAGVHADDQVGQVLDQQAAPVVRVTSAAGIARSREPGGQALPQAAERWLARGHQAAGHIQQEASEWLGVTRKRRRPDDGEAARTGVPRG